MGTAMRSAGILLLEIVLLVLLFSHLASRQRVEPAIAPESPDQWRTIANSAPDHRQQIEKGRLKATQDGYLEILVVASDHRDALRGLVAVRRQLANNDPAVLRQQATAYRRAIATGIGIADEHYTSKAMAILAAASMRAAGEIEGNTRSSA